MKTESVTKKDRTNRTSQVLRVAILRLVALAMLASVLAVGATAPMAEAQPGRHVERGSDTRIQSVQPVRNTPAGETSEIDRQVAAAMNSPHLVAVVQSNELTRTGTVVGLDAQLQGQTLMVVRETALPSQPEFAAMFNGSLNRHFVSAPTYSEPVVITGTEVLVDRTISYELVPGACDKAVDRQALGDLCFAIDRDEEISDDLANDIAAMRTTLAAKPANSLAAPGVTVRQARALSDIDLLDLALNTGPRTIRRLSTIPRDPSGGLAPLDPVDAVTSAYPAAGTPHVAIDQNAVVDHYDFDTDYFLTGFTFALQYGDTWELEASAFGARVYVGMWYGIEAGFGVRAPFSVDVDYLGGDGDQVDLGISVDPVSLDVAAPHVGLPEHKYFDGNEFVLQLDVGCGILVDVPGFEYELTCDDALSVDFNASRDFDPVIGDEVRTIHNWWLWEDGNSPLRFEMGGGRAWAEINVGVGADVDNGQVGARIAGAGAVDVSGVNQSDLTWFNDRAARPVNVAHTDSTGRVGGGLEISDPHYSFDVAIRPKVKLTAGVDVYVYENSWSLVVPLDFLSLSVGFTLDGHAGTVTQHDYDLFGGYLTDAPTEPGGITIDEVGGGSPSNEPQEPEPVSTPVETPVEDDPIGPIKLERDISAGGFDPAG